MVWAFGPWLEATGIRFVEVLGPWGVALAYGIPDATGLPLPPDSLVMLALSGGVSFGACVVFGGAGSIAGASLGFGASRLAVRIPWVQRQMADRATEMQALVERYGMLALGAGALTPLPFSLTAWACGLLGMPFRVFLLVSLLRFPRVALYALPLVWALKWGG